VLREGDNVCTVWGFLGHENMLCTGKESSELSSNCCSLFVMIDQVHERKIHRSLLKSQSQKEIRGLFKAVPFLEGLM